MKKLLLKRDFFPSAIGMSLLVHSGILGFAAVVSLSSGFSVDQGEQSVEFVVLGEDAPSVARQAQRPASNKDFPHQPQQKSAVDVLPDDIQGMISPDIIVDRETNSTEKPVAQPVRDVKIFQSERFSSADTDDARFQEVVVHAAASDTVAQGAVVQGVLRESNNPAPRYPHLARERGWEGVVHIKALVEQDGSASKVIIEKSSGYNVLDTAAVSAVENWHFKAARNGADVLSSWIDIPVRFRLIDQP